MSVYNSYARSKLQESFQVGKHFKQKQNKNLHFV